MKEKKIMNDPQMSGRCTAESLPNSREFLKSRCREVTKSVVGICAVHVCYPVEVSCVPLGTAGAEEGQLGYRHAYE